MMPFRPFIVSATAALLVACGATPGSQATAQGQRDCAAATARYLKVPPDTLHQDSSAFVGSEGLYEVLFTHTTTGQRAKCMVDENGAVLEVIRLR